MEQYGAFISARSLQECLKKLGGIFLRGTERTCWITYYEQGEKKQEPVNMDDPHEATKWKEYWNELFQYAEEKGFGAARKHCYQTCHCTYYTCKPFEALAWADKGEEENENYKLLKELIEKFAEEHRFEPLE